MLGIVLSLYIANTGTVPAADNAATYRRHLPPARKGAERWAVTVTITGGKGPV